MSSLRWREEDICKNRFHKVMSANLSKNWSVQQTLEHYPNAISIFIRLKINCIGCWLEQFCTLEEVSGYYGIPIETLLDYLHDPNLLNYASD
jgi:hypothetical protein